MTEVDNEWDIYRQMVARVQGQQQSVQKISNNIKVLEDKFEQTNSSLSQLEKIKKESQVYSRVGKLFVKDQREHVVEVLDKRLACIREQLACLGRNRCLLSNQLKGSEKCLRELIAMEPVQSLSRAVVMFTHSHPHLSGKKVWVAFNTPTEPRLQEGPQCGIVALVVAAKAMGERDVSVDKVMDGAVKKKFSNRGEMFSVNNMEILAMDVMPSCTVKVEQSTMLLDTLWLVDLLKSGGVILVPYDCGSDNRPIQAKGHKAHWAVISGFLIPSESIPDNSTPLPACPGFHLLSSGSQQEVSCQLEDDCVMLVARQSKSMELGIWSRDKLVESCMNLQEAAQKRLDGSYILPDGGLKAGLCGRMLIIKSSSTKTQ